jgi:CIC family chloride channel protein
MIFELTRDYSIRVPLMLSNLIAFFISQRMQPQPIYEALIRMDGIHLPNRELRPEGARFQVITAMRPAPGPLSPNLAIGEALDRLRGSPLHTWPISDDSGLTAMVTQAELEAAVAGGRGSQPLQLLLKERASSAAPHPDMLPHLHPDHELTMALERLGTLQLDALPVVSRDNVRELLGVVTLTDILHSYGVARTPGDKRPLERA